MLRTYWHRLRSKTRKHGRSETSKCRARLAPFCLGDGADLGFGGDPINDRAIRVDLPNQYGAVGNYPRQLRGTVEKLHWFTDASLDYLYSSHVLEDFTDTEAIIHEWWRVLKPGGRLVIFCPDEKTYKAHCDRTGQYHNEHHVHADFSLTKVKDHLTRVGSYKLIHEVPMIDHYSWELVVEKA